MIQTLNNPHVALTLVDPDKIRWPQLGWSIWLFLCKVQGTWRGNGESDLSHLTGMVFIYPLELHLEITTIWFSSSKAYPTYLQLANILSRRWLSIYERCYIVNLKMYWKRWASGAKASPSRVLVFLVTGFTIKGSMDFKIKVSASEDLVILIFNLEGFEQ